MAELKKGDRVAVHFSDVTMEGVGVGTAVSHEDSRKVFCFGAREGETAEVKVIKSASSYLVARTDGGVSSPVCGSFPACGGCSLLHFTYEESLKIKEKFVAGCLSRIAHLEEGSFEFEPIVPSPETLAFRNKNIYRFIRTEKGIECGFYRRNSHDTVVTPLCATENASSRKVRESFSKIATEAGLSLYDESTGRGLLRSLMVRVSSFTGEACVCVCINGEKLPRASEIARKIEAECGFPVSFSVNVNRDRTNTVFSDDFRHIYGPPVIKDRIGDAIFEISPASFFQVNPSATVKLYEKAFEYAFSDENENAGAGGVLLDLYCGIGTIGIFFAKKLPSLGGLIGIEWTPQAVENARRNAALNGISCKSEFFAGDAQQVLESIKKTEGTNAAQMLEAVKTVVVDPPRKGLGDEIPAMLSNLNAERIVYVSCNPATLARDLERFTALGWRTVKVCPVDMFPFAGHVETVVLMSRAKV